MLKSPMPRAVVEMKTTEPWAPRKSSIVAASSGPSPSIVLATGAIVGTATGPRSINAPNGPARSTPSVTPRAPAKVPAISARRMASGLRQRGLARRAQAREIVSGMV